MPLERDLVGFGADIHISRRNLPHWTISTNTGAVYWITFRLADSIPQKTLRAWRNNFNVWKQTHPPPWDAAVWAEYDERFGNHYEAWLDQGNGSRALAKSHVRDVVISCLTRFAGERFLLHAAVIMPTHVHALMQPLQHHTITALLKGIKGASARLANQLLGATGSFWHDESYDHIVRSNEQLAYYFRYVADNPRKAGLSSDEYWLYKK
ncbi:transposase [Ereboglobus luteus]|uniref:Transposase IS200-like domain-containing protein n=1 Tax=Ereboglobus luteus TaxID=1796921 RepID=A0A2U8E2V1_9BACT|nr:transposase [Ereboglobus luteus]AWI09208.1 hypothetical protein CKA38_08120 [Ereboglobus luteus]